MSNSLSSLVECFHRDGYVLLPNIISPAELTALRADVESIMNLPRAEQTPESDYFYDPDQSGREVFHRVQYIFGKGRTARDGGALLTLLGHPVVLQLAHALLGDDMICAAEALVFKLPGNGRAVPVHADCDPADPRLAPLLFNVDFYLDDSTLENGCLYASPGSHRPGRSAADIARTGFDFPGLIPVPANAGDVIFHDTRVVHGSHQSRGSQLRRTLYYEFQSLSALLQQGGPRPGYPVNPTWVHDRIQLLLHAIAARRKSSYAQKEAPFTGKVHAEITAETNPDKVNLRPALGYNKYF